MLGGESPSRGGGGVNNRATLEEKDKKIEELERKVERLEQDRQAYNARGETWEFEIRQKQDNIRELQLALDKEKEAGHGLKQEVQFEKKKFQHELKKKEQEVFIFEEKLNMAVRERDQARKVREEMESEVQEAEAKNVRNRNELHKEMVGLKTDKRKLQLDCEEMKRLMESKEKGSSGWEKLKNELGNAKREVKKTP